MSINKKLGGRVLVSDLLIGVTTAFIAAKAGFEMVDARFFHQAAILLCLPMATMGTYLYQKNNIFSEFLGALLVKLAVSLFGFFFVFLFYTIMVDKI